MVDGHRVTELFHKNWAKKMGSVGEEMATGVSPPRQQHGVLGLSLGGGQNQGYQPVGMQAGSTSRLRRLQRQLALPNVWDQRIRHVGLILGSCLAVVLCVLWITETANASKIANLDPGFFFLSIGDFGTGAEPQIDVAKQMSATAAQYKAEFVVGLGDNFYQAGITGLDDPQIQEKYESIYTDPALQVPWYMSLGDHDQRGNVAAQVAYTNVSNKWQMPAPFFVKHITSKFNQHTLDLIFTDSIGLEGGILLPEEPRRFQEDYNDTYSGKKAGDNQMQWLQQVLKQSTADWKIVVGHRPLFSCALRDRKPVEERLHEHLMPMFQKNSVDVYLHGHDHIGQYSVRGGIVHIGNGVGGYDTHKASADKDTIWFNNTYHGFILHHVTATQLKTMFLDQDGTLLQTAVIMKHGGHQDEPSL